METQGLGAGSYPEPKENGKEVSADVVVEYSIHDSFPKDWDYDRIEEEIKANLFEYVSSRDYNNIEIADIREE